MNKPLKGKIAVVAGATRGALKRMSLQVVNGEMIMKW